MDSPKPRVPPVVVWSAFLYVVLLGSTILVYSLGPIGPDGQGRPLQETMLDGLKVGLGALIGVLSQWAHQSLRAERAAGKVPAS